MRRMQQLFGFLAADAVDLGLQLHGDTVVVAVDHQRDFGRDGHPFRLQLVLAGDGQDGAAEAARIARGEQLLRIRGAGFAGAGHCEIQMQHAVAAIHMAVAAGGGGGDCGIGHGYLLPAM